MHDAVTVKKLSEKQLQDLMLMVSAKLDGVSENNQETYELLLQQIDVFRTELIERQMLVDLRNEPLPTMSLTRDELSEAEEKQIKKDNETKNKQ
jgi:hypothetical protein